jgi:hypothetical protein
MTGDALIEKAKEILAANPDNRCVKHLVALKEAGKLDAMSPEDLAGLYACAKTGVENEKSGLGCYAMAPGDYDKYADFFDAVCNDYHNNPAGDKVHVTNWSLEGVAGLPEDGQLDISKLGLKDELSMRVRVGRNLTTFPLPGELSLLALSCSPRTSVFLMYWQFALSLSPSLNTRTSSCGVRGSTCLFRVLRLLPYAAPCSGLTSH